MADQTETERVAELQRESAVDYANAESDRQAQSNRDDANLSSYQAARTS